MPDTFKSLGEIDADAGRFYGFARRNRSTNREGFSVTPRGQAPRHSHGQKLNRVERPRHGSLQSRVATVALVASLAAILLPAVPAAAAQASPPSPVRAVDLANEPYALPAAPPPLTDPAVSATCGPCGARGDLAFAGNTRRAGCE